MNYSFLTGRLGKDPEVFAPNNSEYSCLKFSIANNDETKKNQDTGEYENITSWFDIVFWTKKPQYWIKKLIKGKEIEVPCRAKQETWEKDGQNRSKIVFYILRGEFPKVFEDGRVETAPAKKPYDPEEEAPF